MPARPRVPTAACCVGAAGADGLFATNAGHLLALGLVVLAVALGIALVTMLLRARRRERRSHGASHGPAMESPLSRLEYLPAVTSRAPRLRWRGSRYWFIGRVEQRPHEEVHELVGSPASLPSRARADARPASGSDGGGDEGAAAAP